jgi:hypothetical protein
MIWDTRMLEPISYHHNSSLDNLTILKTKMAQTDNHNTSSNHLNRDKVETSSLGSSDKESIAISESF